jgi:hypothetical protein
MIVQKLIRAPKCPRSGLTGARHAQRVPSLFNTDIQLRSSPPEGGTDHAGSELSR